MLYLPQLPVMEQLLQHGADKGATDVNGHTAAELAAALGHTDMVLLLTGKKPSKCIVLCACANHKCSRRML